MIEQFKDYFEVSLDEYKSLLYQLKKDFFHLQEEDYKYISIRALVDNETGEIICGTTFDKVEEVPSYYIINLPQKEKLLPPRKVQKYTLQTEEEIEAFINILHKINGGKADE